MTQLPLFAGCPACGGQLEQLDAVLCQCVACRRAWLKAV
jgi:hypothetical protein